MWVPRLVPPKLFNVFTETLEINQPCQFVAMSSPSRDRCVNTTVINSGPQLDQHLREFLCTIFECTQTKMVVGLGVGKCYKDNHPTPKYGTSTGIIIGRVSTLKLSFKNTCLIIQLLHIKSASALISLSKFLQLVELSFVGVGIKHSLNALERDYGITCRNAVGLGELGAAVKGEESLRACGLVDSAHMFHVFNKKAAMSRCTAVAF